LIGVEVDEPGVKKREVPVKLDDHVLAQCHWARALAAGETVVDEVVLSSKSLQKYLNTQPPDSPLKAELASLLEERAPSGKGARALSARPAAPAPRDLPIRVEPTVRSAVIGIAPTLEEAAVLEDGKRSKRVNYRGVVGWVDADDR